MYDPELERTIKRVKTLATSLYIVVISVTFIFLLFWNPIIENIGGGEEVLKENYGYFVEYGPVWWLFLFSEIMLLILPTYEMIKVYKVIKKIRQKQEKDASELR